jgi:hypothetical protein
VGVLAGAAAILSVPVPALACGGLIAPNGAVGLVKTSTMAGYVDGVEHYVTQFEFAGAKGEFGSIVPLPGVPTRVVRGGAWTLERLAIEVQPPVLEAVAVGGAQESRTLNDVEVLEQKRIGALDITVLRGGGPAVGEWAEENGFSLTPDAPEVLDFYASRSPVFMAAKFDAAEAARRGLEAGQGTSIHLAIPTDDPWVPLRILALGQSGDAVVKADVFLLTGRQPAMLPGPAGSGAVLERDGLTLLRDEPASRFLLRDLNGDRGMGWLPGNGMWFSYLKLTEEAEDLTYDLALDVTGAQPSVVDAGLVLQAEAGTDLSPWIGMAALIGILGVVGVLVVSTTRREVRPA